MSYAHTSAALLAIATQECLPLPPTASDLDFTAASLATCPDCGRKFIAYEGVMGAASTYCSLPCRDNSEIGYGYVVHV